MNDHRRMPSRGATYAAAFIAAIDRGLRAVRDPGRAVQQAAYMRGQWPFIGVTAPKLKVVLKETLTEVGEPWHARQGAVVSLADPRRIEGEVEAVAVLRALWDTREEREFCNIGISVATSFATAVAKGVKTQQKSAGDAMPLPFPELFFDTVRHCIVSKVGCTSSAVLGTFFGAIFGAHSCVTHACTLIAACSRGGTLWTCWLPTRWGRWSRVGRTTCYR